MEYWDNYMSLFSDEDRKIQIATWAFTVAIVTFFLNFIGKPIYKKILRLFSNVNVEAGISHTLIASAYGTNVGMPLITVSVVNNTDKTIFINNPSFKTSRKINGDDKFVVPKKVGVFPKKLEVGEKFSQDYDSTSMYNQILSKLRNSDKVSFIISTTSKKQYKSNPLCVKRILEHMTIPEELNSVN